MSTVAKGEFSKWLSLFDLQYVNAQGLSELVFLLSLAQDKHLMALTDLLRLLVLNETCANELIGNLLWPKIH